MSFEYCGYCMHRRQRGQKCEYCGATTSYEAPVHHLKQGTVLREKYLVGRAIGEGGFGITYIGRDLTLDIRIAIKEYYPNGFSNRNNDHSNQVTMSTGNHGDEFEREMQRFLSEARILAKFCNNPGVVGVRDFFRENGTAYIVMEYLDGISLKNYLKHYGPIAPAQFQGLIDPILQTLHEIHKQGLIHRDISPDNIMMLRDGRLKLLDFGAAREVGGEKSLSVILKPGYAPEEQYRSKGQQGPWTDVYAMCATIYKCITNVTPEESIQRVFDDSLKRPSELGVPISAGFEQAIMMGLQIKSTERIQSMDQLRKTIAGSGSEPMHNVRVQRMQNTGDRGNESGTAPRTGGANVVTSSRKTGYHTANGATIPAQGYGGTGDSYSNTPAVENVEKKRTGKIIAIVAAAVAGWALLICLGIAIFGGGKAPSGGKTDSGEKNQVSMGATSPAATSEATYETMPAESTMPAAPSATVVSDDWKDFTFELNGVVYELPTHYQNFVAQGWKVDGTRSDLTEDDMVGGYSHESIVLTNGNVYFSAEVVNMSGNLRAVKDCDIGSITVSGYHHVDLKLSGGITCQSDKDDIVAAYGTPSSTNSYSSSVTLRYEVDDYIMMYFYQYLDNSDYNDITIRNFVAQERDATTPKDERPAYLDNYVAPTELGSDITATRFELDGVIYQLPCPLEAFTDNGWTIKSDSIGSLGAWEDESGVTLEKGDYRIYLTMMNFAPYETYVKNCAVSAVTLDGTNFKNAPKDVVKLPGGINMWTKTADAAKVYKNFSRYDGTYATSFTYDNEDYTVKVGYSYYKDTKVGYINLKNKNWTY